MSGLRLQHSCIRMLTPMFCASSPSSLPQSRSWPNRQIRTACMPKANSAGDLTKYMTMLTKAQQDEALEKFAAAGFAGGREDLVPSLNSQELESIGIQPQVVRSALLWAFTQGGLEKTVVLVDSTGTEEEWLFRKQDFDVWSHANSLKQLLPDGRKQVVASWERLEEGGRYLTDMLLDKPERYEEQDTMPSCTVAGVILLENGRFYGDYAYDDHHEALDKFISLFSNRQDATVHYGSSVVTAVDDSDPVKVQTLILYGVPKQCIVQQLKDVFGSDVCN